MNTERFERSLCDTIKEEQLKLGFEKETLRLYYPLESLAAALEVEGCTVPEMRKWLKEFRELVKDRLGELRFSDKEERFCIAVPPEGLEYVHRTIPDSPFLKELLLAVNSHNCLLSQIKELFLRHAAHVTCEKSTEKEFDYVMSFPDGKPDDYFYCLKWDGPHVTYHRFVRSDYERMFSSEQ